MTSFKTCLIIGSVLILLAIPICSSPYFITFMFAIFMYTILATSWNMLSGYTGYLSLGQTVFFGAGGYTFAILVAEAGVHWLVSLLLSGIVAGLIALIMGYILLSRKMQVAYFAMITLGLNEIMRVLLTNLDVLQGSSGIMISPIPFASFGYYILLIITLGCILVSYFIDKTSLGLGLKAILQDEDAAECMGVNTAKLKISVFVMSAIFPGITGAIVAWNWSYIDPRMAFDLMLSFHMVIMAVLGGLGTLWGPILGACFLTVLIELLWTNVPYFPAIIFGFLVILVVILEPGGLVKLFTRIKVHSFSRA